MGIVLSQVIAHRANLGYENFKNEHLVSFNGEPVKNLRHLDEMIRGTHDLCPTLTFEFHSGLQVMLDRETVQKATEEVCAREIIPAAKHFLDDESATSS